MRIRVVAYAFAVLTSAFLVPGPAERFAMPAAASAYDCDPLNVSNITIVDFGYAPNCIMVVKNTQINWTNLGATVHSATTDAGAPKSFDNDPILPGQFDDTFLNKAPETLNTLGIYHYHCKYHPDQMKGVIVVVDDLPEPDLVIEASDDNAFAPDDANATAGQDIVWTNVGTSLHNVVFEDDAIGHVGELPQGATVDLTLDQAGLYRYRCQYHSANFGQGMVGVITVLGEDEATPPRLTIDAPAPGASVRGTINVTGGAQAGLGDVNVTTVDVRVGSAGEWRTAALAGASPTWTWSYSWDTTTAPEGNVTVYARALSEEYPAPSPVTVGVVVANSASANGTTTTTPGSGGEDDTDTPGVGPLALMVAASALALVLRRRSA